MQLKVVKNDCSKEDYLYTKVFGTFNNALVLIDQPCTFVAEQFTEAVTFYLYQKCSLKTIKSEEIHLLILSVLNATGYGNAADALNDFRLVRKLKRSRIEVFDSENVADELAVAKWDKTRVSSTLIAAYEIDSYTARAIATAVEEKVLRLGSNRIGTELLRQIVLAETEIMLVAERELLSVV